MKEFLVLGIFVTGFFGVVSFLLMRDIHSQEELKSTIKATADSLNDPRLQSLISRKIQNEPTSPGAAPSHSMADRKPASEALSPERIIFDSLSDASLVALENHYEKNPESVTSLFRDYLASSRARENPTEFSNVMDHLVHLASVTHSMELVTLAKEELNHQFVNSKTLSKEQMGLLYSWKQVLESQ
jgi:hypothetical protein